MKRVLYGISIILFALTQVACDRDYKANIVNTTPPALEVVVKSATGQPLSNTTVKLYNTEASWNAETGEIASMTTTAQGSVIFTDQLTQPGFYFVMATDGTKKTKVKTKYLLRTDGKTRLNIVL